jgi:hypothetical protein
VNRDLPVKAPFILKQQERMLLREHYLRSNVLHIPIILVPVTNFVILYLKFLAVCKAKCGVCSVSHMPSATFPQFISFIYHLKSVSPSMNASTAPRSITVSTADIIQLQDVLSSPLIKAFWAFNCLSVSSLASPNGSTVLGQ